MTETTERRGGAWKYLLLLLILLGGAVAGAAWYLKLGPFQREGGAFIMPFKGCDSAGRCANFRLFAPGEGYRWNMGGDELDTIPDSDEPLDVTIAREMVGATGVIAAGLASREGGDNFNNALSSCRSYYLAAVINEAKQRSGSQADVYRITLGRYQGLEADETSGNTEIERMVVMAFIQSADPNVDLSAALKSGLSRDLPEALKSLLAPLARQLDFRKYRCWNDDFAVTPASELRNVCYREVSDDLAYCRVF